LIWFIFTFTLIYRECTNYLFLCVELPGPVGGGPFLVGRKEWLRAEETYIREPAH